MTRVEKTARIVDTLTGAWAITAALYGVALIHRVLVALEVIR